MQEILIATLVVGVVGLLLGLALVTASKKFYVEVDDRVTKVRECLRGANCGACGYAGCDAVAEAIVKGEARVDAFSVYLVHPAAYPKPQRLDYRADAEGTAGF